ncbi:toxin YoeB [Cnuella takakiae]|uniref:Putative mRNA interferase YoeB n=1 Tax=Cnuella takakiae TaxID=1302690 RepID=A0A1M5A9Q4_9BACT|nr:Txe/YoeB family addiction module toxin [Cnuella takakiae]OLY92040.1 addiction module protein [Cnuella takakiae]SHF27050.1 toxin YoeB [Cnuella takakiae]
MNFEFTVNIWEDFEYWIDNDPDISEKIRALLKDLSRNPFQGLGKPEPLKFDLKNYWSRRISGEHRLVYKIEGSKGKDQKCIILQCRFHYD